MHRFNLIKTTMKTKPVIRITKPPRYNGKYKYTHVRGNLKPLIKSEVMGFDGYIVTLTIGIQLFERFAR